ncbi:MerR family transcriptional regulator [Microbacterium radiodurans]|uniref:MerR family transcriptional regulator n=1 Tax=Microbacterium radiodurans TaxID=661398 RepID=A0A5J5IP58_9MICO|nr:MerR family transcriptional regulator [Microbacterium radiodurans]KAA9085403.1 MerR family transcriptional regulator [Microbacterium radiodurans]
MLTIGQLAAYAGVTVAAVRHYHRVGLLPEPERDRSGYRSYDADAVVRLIRIHVLAAAGVPLARVADLLDADAAEFGRGIREIDARLRAEVRRLQDARARLAQLAAGEQLALPASVVGYLDRLRAMGVAEGYIEEERDAWILVAAQLPDTIDEVIAGKHRDLDDPDLVRLYGLLSDALSWTADDPRVVEVADILDRINTRALASGAADELGLEQGLIDLLDSRMLASSPAAGRLIELLEERGWRGWTRLRRVAAAPDQDD